MDSFNCDVQHEIISELLEDNDNFSHSFEYFDQNLATNTLTTSVPLSPLPQMWPQTNITNDLVVISFQSEQIILILAKKTNQSEN